VLASRIDRLLPEEKRLLQTAAVIGENVPFTLLQAIADMPEDALYRSLNRLQAADFLHEANLFPELEYAFRHALTHEVAYSSLLQERRHALHARIVAALETLYADRLLSQVEQLAHHAMQGEEWEKAVIYCRQAGAKAAARSVYREAVAYFEQALLALQQLPETPTTLRQAFDLRMELTRRLVPLADYGRILENLREAQAIAEAQGDRRRLGRVCSAMTDYFRLTGNSEQAVAYGERALAFAVELEDFPLRVLANQRLGIACYAVGDHRRAIQLLRQNVTLIGGELLHERFSAGSLPSVMSRSYIVFPMVDLGEFAEAVAVGEEAMQIAEEADTIHSQVLAAHCVGLAHLCKGDFDLAIPLLEQTLSRCQVSYVPLDTRLLTSAIGYAYALSGRVADAIPLLEQAVRQAETLKVLFRYALWLAWLGEAYLLAGRTDNAREFAERAVEHASTYKEPGFQAYALRLGGDIAAHGGGPTVEQAEAVYRQALTMADALEMRPLQAQCHLGLGKLYRRARLLEQAQHELSTAMGLFRAMEMTFWLRQTEALFRRMD
jgi:tetratricopeptide (TPR) repeat protein